MPLLNHRQTFTRKPPTLDLSDYASLAPEQEPTRTLVSASNSSYISGTQQAAYLIEAKISASVTISWTNIGFKTPCLFSYSSCFSDPNMPALDEADTEENK